VRLSLRASGGSAPDQAARRSPHRCDEKLDHGVDLKILNGRLGQANVIVTGQIYDHRSTRQDAPSADPMAKLIYGGPDQQ
jgi:hypothetical protein